jgi:hypothetical protein
MPSFGKAQSGRALLDIKTQWWYDFYLLFPMTSKGYPLRIMGKNEKYKQVFQNAKCLKELTLHFLKHFLFVEEKLWAIKCLPTTLQKSYQVFQQNSQNSQIYTRKTKKIQKFPYFLSKNWQNLSQINQNKTLLPMVVDSHHYNICHPWTTSQVELAESKV